MQPYFIPYIGYWQLMNVVEKYVIYDDVNYINRGWINRNRILVNGEPRYINIPMIGASQNKKINEIEVSHNSKEIAKKLRTIETVYKKAPNFDKIFPMITQIMNSRENKLSSYIESSLHIICLYLEIKTEFILSSQLNKNSELRGQEKILEICSLLGATEYYNAIGGKELYSTLEFRKRGIELKFIKTDHIEYSQFNNTFQPNLSIIDVMMFNSKESVKEMLGAYTIVT